MSFRELAVQTYIIALPIVLGYIVWLLQQQKKTRDANSDGTRALIMIKLIEYHDKYCPLGYVPSYVYQNVGILYEAYKGLKGNGMITRMVEELKQLEIRKGEE